MNEEERKRIVAAGLKHMTNHAPNIMLPKDEGPTAELLNKAKSAVVRVRALMQPIYEAARDAGDFAKPGAKGRLAAQCTEMFIKEFNDRSTFDYDDVLWLAAIAHAMQVVDQLL